VPNPRILAASSAMAVTSGRSSTVRAASRPMIAAA